jgi:hypothetical protein
MWIKKRDFADVYDEYAVRVCVCAKHLSISQRASDQQKHLIVV